VHIDMEMWTEIRRKVLVEGVSKRQIRRDCRIGSETLAKILANPEPSGYRLRVVRPKPMLGAFTGVIDEILVSDRDAPPKQRHTGRRIFERLRDEYGYRGGDTQVRDYVAETKWHLKKVFVPLSHPAGEVQFDFGEATVVIAGERCKAALAVMTLPFSDAWHVSAYPRECTETFQAGHVAAFEFFAGVPTRTSYDNTAIAVKKVVGPNQRGLTTEFLRLESHFLFDHHFCRVGRGNEKGYVEGLVGYSRRNTLVPVPEFATHDFVDGCRDRNVRFSVGLPVDQRVRDSVLLAQEEDWIPAVETDGSDRDGAWVIELTDLIDFTNWPEHTRVIARRERPHPGAQLSLFDQHEGFRHQIFITDQPDTDIALLELRHRNRAHVENRIRAAKDTGLRNLPCADVVCNDAWLQLVLIAQELIAWSQALCFDGALKIAEQKRLRHRVFHAAAAVVHSGGQVIVRFQRTWPWVDDIVTASTRLASRSLPEPREHCTVTGTTAGDTRPKRARPTREPHAHPPPRRTQVLAPPTTNSSTRSAPKTRSLNRLLKCPGLPHTRSTDIAHRAALDPASE